MIKPLLYLFSLSPPPLTHLPHPQEQSYRAWAYCTSSYITMTGTPKNSVLFTELNIDTLTSNRTNTLDTS